MKKIFPELFIIIISLLLVFLVSSCDAEWFIGHDNGEAYIKYQEEMRKYINENGLSPDIYGYGWVKE